MDGIIYLTTNTLTGDTYIGQTTKSCNWTIYYGENIYYGSGNLILKQLKEYHYYNFTRETIEIIEGQAKLNQREAFWIKFFKPTLNIMKWSCGSGGHSDKTKQLMIKSHQETNRRKKFEKIYKNNADMNKVWFYQQISNEVSLEEIAHHFDLSKWKVNAKIKELCNETYAELFKVLCKDAYNQKMLDARRSRKLILDKDELYDLIDKGLSVTNKLPKHFSCYCSVINRNINEYWGSLSNLRNIQKEKNNADMNKVWLYQQISNEVSLKEIVHHFGLSTLKVNAKIKELCNETYVSIFRAKIILDKDELYDLIDKGLSLRKLAKHFSCHSSVITRTINELGFSIKSKKYYKIKRFNNVVVKKEKQENDTKTT